MTQELVKQDNEYKPEIFSALKNSLYPGAKDDSIKMVLDYCKAAKLDPMLKPVHIVPMSVKVPGTKDQYEYRDTVMPGIGLYRIQADRTGLYAGISEPEFGEDITERIGALEITYPRWCRIKVFKIVDGQIREFVAKELWKENYASRKKDDPTPNAMWAKRPYGQIGKCAEAQALRKAFPELGSQPTAEEMEGKILDGIYEVLDENNPVSKKLDNLKARIKPKENPIPSSSNKEVSPKVNDVTLQEILDKIHESKNIQSLELIVSMAKKLDEEDKKRARHEYDKRKKELQDEAESKAKEFFGEQ